MGNFLQKIGHDVGALMCMLENAAPDKAQRIAISLSDLSTDLASAIARHINCDHGAGWYNDMEIGASLYPKGASIDDHVDIFLDDLIGIAYETAMSEADQFAARYLAIVRDAAQDVAAAYGVAVVNTADSYNTLYTPFAVFGPAFDDQPNMPNFPNQTGDLWRNAAAHIDKTRHTAAEISANRRKALDCYTGSPIWPLIAAKLSGTVALDAVSV